MIYLDNSATTKQHPAVTATMIRCMEEDFGNPSSLHRMGLATEKIVKEARKKVASAMGRNSGEVIFTSGGTESDNLAILGCAKAMKRRGNRVVTTSVEHPAALECFGELENRGFEVVRLKVDRQGMIDSGELENSIDDRTILVSVMQVNNEVGTIMPVDEAAELIKRKNSPALLHCDAVQSFGKMKLPAKADMISLSGHKIHGPKGVGALWIREGLNLPPLILGGGQEQNRRSGTENVPAIAGFGEAAALSGDVAKGNAGHVGTYAKGNAELAPTGPNGFQGSVNETRHETFDRVKAMRERLLEGLRGEIGSLPSKNHSEGVVLNGPEEAGTDPGCASPYILNVSFPGTRGEVILHTLEQDGIYVSTGSACSSNKKGRSHVLQAMGCTDAEAEGAIRFSFSSENTMEEIEETISRTTNAVKRFRELGSFR